MFTALFKTRKRQQGSPLNETPRPLVQKKFEILRQASVGFTEDRLLHIQGEDFTRWTDECTDELRGAIESAAPSQVTIELIYFRPLGCVSLQCLRAEGARVPRAPHAPRKEPGHQPIPLTTETTRR